MRKDDFSILVDGEILYHSPKDYGDTTAEGEAPMRLSNWIAANPWAAHWAPRLAALEPGRSLSIFDRQDVEIRRVGGDPTINENACRVVDVTFDTVSEESVTEGDTDRRGWKRSIVIKREELDDEDPCFVEATIRALRVEGAPDFMEADSSSGTPRWLNETDAAIDEERRSFHFSGGGFTDEEILRIARGMRVYGYSAREEKREIDANG